jgi:hypothetical protein
MLNIIFLILKLKYKNNLSGLPDLGSVQTFSGKNIKIKF